MAMSVNLTQPNTSAGAGGPGAGPQQKKEAEKIAELCEFITKAAHIPRRGSVGSGCDKSIDYKSNSVTSFFNAKVPHNKYPKTLEGDKTVFP